MALVTTAHEYKFQRCLERILRYLLALVATAEPLPDEAARIQAMHTLSYAFGAPDLWPLTRQLIFTLAPKMEQAGHRGDWLVYLEQATVLSEQATDWATAAECYLQRGVLHRLLSEFPQAIERLQQSLTLCQQIGDQRTAARALNELAWVAYLQNRTTPATTYVEQARALLAADDPEQAMCDRVQGMIAIAHERWGEAEELHRQALTIFEAQGDQRKTAWSLQNLAYALRGQGRYEESIGYYEEAASLLHEQGDLYHWSIVQMNLGLTYQSSNLPELATHCYTAARSIPQSMLDLLHQARLSLNMALAWMTLAQFSEAEQEFGQAIQLHRATGAISWCLNAMDGLAMTYIAWQKFDQAIQVLEQALAELPTVIDAPNYNYLDNSLHHHLEEARNGQHTYSGSGLPLR